MGDDDSVDVMLFAQKQDLANVQCLPYTMAKQLKFIGELRRRCRTEQNDGSRGQIVAAQEREDDNNAGDGVGSLSTWSEQLL